MNLFFTIFGIFSVSVVFSVAQPVKRLNVFYKKEIAKPLYSEFYKTKLHTDEEPTTDPTTKKLLCHYITGSKLLFSSHYERVYLYDIHEELKTKYREIFDELYPKSDDISASQSKVDRMVYVNPTKLRNVHPSYSNEAAVLEQVFLCPIQKKDHKNVITMEKYYVSEEYNVKEASNDTDEKIVGRFIFHLDKEDGQNRILLHGFAEVPATVSTTSIAEVERIYLERRRVSEPAENASDDFLCQLSSNEKLRVCNLVLNSRPYDGDLNFDGKVVREYEQEESGGCFKKKLSFQSKEASDIGNENEFKEWVIRCRTGRHDHSSDLIWYYYVSRAYGAPDEVFVYTTKKEDSKISLDNLSANMRFRIPSEENTSKSKVTSSSEYE